jgi:hypothetical protein
MLQRKENNSRRHRSYMRVKNPRGVLPPILSKEDHRPPQSGIEVGGAAIISAKGFSGTKKIDLNKLRK